MDIYVHSDSWKHVGTPVRNRQQRAEHQHGKAMRVDQTTWPVIWESGSWCKLKLCLVFAQEHRARCQFNPRAQRRVVYNSRFSVRCIIADCTNCHYSHKQKTKRTAAIRWLGTCIQSFVDLHHGLINSFGHFMHPVTHSCCNSYVHVFIHFPFIH